MESFPYQDNPHPDRGLVVVVVVAVAVVGGGLFEMVDDG